MKRSSTTSITRGVRHTVMVLLALVTLLGAGLPALTYAENENQDEHALPQLQQEADQQPDKEFRVIVSRASADGSTDQKVSATGTKVKDIEGHNGLVAKIKGRDIKALAKDPSVRYIAPDAAMFRTGDDGTLGDTPVQPVVAQPAAPAPVAIPSAGPMPAPVAVPSAGPMPVPTTVGVNDTRLQSLYTQATGATELWNQRAKPVYAGDGIGVAVIDSGMAPGLPDFQDDAGKSRVVANITFNDFVDTSTIDKVGHGTHVAGIVAGNGWHSADPTTAGRRIGIAPGANLVNIKVVDDNGKCYVSDVVKAIEWSITNRVLYNIRVINLSLVSSVAESAKTSILDAAVEHAWFNGIFVVVAAGNTGANTMQFPPANDPFVVTVGAVDLNNSMKLTDHSLAPWSSYGLTQDGFAKPEVVAPGRYTVSVLAPKSTFAQNYPGRIVDTNYISMSGTSMAAPVVAGIAALAFQAHPEWSNDQVKWLLSATAQRLRAAPADGQGSGEVRAEALVSYKGIPGQANQGLAISQQLVGPNGMRTYVSGVMSRTTSSWTTSSWTTSSWTTSSWTTSSWTTSSWTTSSWTTTFAGDVW
ncbi:MAG: hypothetical protein NVS2B7_14590 [Herpetosiphon sp.]